MNIVIVSVNFFPAKDAESFCATRFASALARRGHNVHVVTTSAVSIVSDEIYQALVDSQVRITRVPFSPRTRSIPAQFRYRCADWETTVMKDLIAATKNALASMDNAILMTRTYPVSSLIVGWHCRRLAKKWICHLSDPIPHATWMPKFSFAPRKFMDWLKWRWIRHWISRGFAYADAISVTCPGALRYYRERYPRSFGGKPKFVTTHIGDNRLDFLATKHFKRPAPGKMVLYAGELYASRKMDALADAVLKLNRKGLLCSLVHVGAGNDIDSALRLEFPSAYFRYSDSPGLAVSAAKEADVLYVTDSITGLSYSPQILSKFVYQLFESKPLLIETAAEGIMHQCCVDYPEAGLFWIDRDNLNMTGEALEAALNCDVGKIDRSRIRQMFSEETIVDDYVNNVQSLLR